MTQEQRDAVQQETALMNMNAVELRPTNPRRSPPPPQVAMVYVNEEQAESLHAEVNEDFWRERDPTEPDMPEEDDDQLSQLSHNQLIRYRKRLCREFLAHSHPRDDSPFNIGMELEFYQLLQKVDEDFDYMLDDYAMTEPLPTVDELRHVRDHLPEAMISAWCERHHSRYPDENLDDMETQAVYIIHWRRLLERLSG